MTQYEGRWPSALVRWRSLSWAEYYKYRWAIDLRPAEVACQIYETVRVTGPDLEDLPFGIAAVIADHVLSTSGFAGDLTSISEALKSSRSRVGSSYLLCAQAVVASTFGYKPEEVAAMDSDTFFTRLAQAELITRRPLDPVDPQAEVKAESTPKGRPKRPLTAGQAAVLERVANSNRGK